MVFTKRTLSGYLTILHYWYIFSTTEPILFKVYTII